jgi:multiple sugar transport system permease protein
VTTSPILDAERRVNYATHGTKNRGPAWNSRRRQRFLGWVAAHAIAISLSLLFTLPFVFIFLTSVMTDQQALTGNLWPRIWQWSNYRDVFANGDFLVWTRNSFIYAIAGTALMLVTSLPPAYAMARMRFRGRNLAFALVIATMMLPAQVVVVPMYLIWSRLGLTGSLWPLIIPLAFGDGFSIFLLRQFLLTIPQEFLDAARIDGCGTFGALLRIVIPLSKPGLLAVGLFQFFFCWNDYFGPQIYASENPGAWTLSYGLESFKSAHHANWNLTMSATILVMLPVVLLFFFAQKQFLQGVTLTGVKG